MKTTKEKTAHTPGPWIVDDCHIHPATGLTYPRGTEPETDVILMVDTSCHHNGLIHDTDRANLALAASAPTLKADNERLTNQAAQLRDALQGVTRENEGMRDALCQVRDIARNCLQGAVPAVAKITFGLPIKTMLAIACASLDSIQSHTASGKGGQVSKYTPGPWGMEELNIRTHGGIDVATVDEQEDSNEANANVRLIASTPDLLSLAEHIALDPYSLTPDQWASEARQVLAKIAGQPTTQPCPACGRHENGAWISPCPSDDCPSRDKEDAQ